MLACGRLGSASRAFVCKPRSQWRFFAFPAHELVKMPALSPTMTKGNIAQWKLKEGDKVSPGKVYCSVETDKAVVDFESQEDGFLAKILVPDGTADVEVNSPLAVLVENKGDVGKFADFKAGAAPVAAPVAPAVEVKTATAAPVAAAATPVVAPSSGGRVFASPLAQATAAKSNVNLSSVSGTGPNNRVINADVLDFVSKQVQAPVQVAAPVAAQPVAATGGYKDVPLTQMRKIIAERLLQSKQEIPHYYLTSELNMDKLMKLRESLNTPALKLSVNDYIIKAAALALKQHPELNSTYHPGTAPFTRVYSYVDISVAVSTDGGLITPIVRDADLKGIKEISLDVKKLAEKAKANKLLPTEFQGGTFTISNLGMYGVDSFTAIINPPQTCILAVGGISSKLAMVKDQVVSTNVMKVSLSCDHRVVDGALGATWLKTFKGLIENPMTMLL